MLKKAPIVVMLLFSILIIALGIFGCIEANKKVEEQPPKEEVYVDYDKLYNYIQSFNYEYISLDETNPGYTYSDLHQNYYVNVDTLSNEAIIRSAIKQLVTCDGEYVNQIIPYNVVVSKIKEITNKDLQFTSEYILISTGDLETSYSCDINGCILLNGSYCNTSLNNNYTIVEKRIEDNNVIIIDMDSNNNLFTHTFTKGEDHYYWVSSVGNVNS